VLPRLLPREQDGDEEAPRLFLETPALREGSYARPEVLARVLALARRELRARDPRLRRVGLCLDTAHLWAGGQDVASRRGARAWLRAFRRAGAAPAGGLAVHLNDNLHPRGSGRDEHAPLARGAIWGAHARDPAASGLADFVRFALEQGAPLVLERRGERSAPGGGAALSLEQALAHDYDVLKALGAN
jgi:Endonuclease IV